MMRDITENVQIPITLRPSLVKWTAIFVLCTGFVLGGIWMVREGHSAGYFVASVFSIGWLVAVIQFIPGAGYLRLTADGFTYCSFFREHTVRWAQVLEFGIVRVNIWMVAWNFAPDYPPPGRGRNLSVSICGYEAALPDTYGMKPGKLLELMESLRQKFGKAA